MWPPLRSFSENCGHADWASFELEASLPRSEVARGKASSRIGARTIRIRDRGARRYAFCGDRWQVTASRQTPMRLTVGQARCCSATARVYSCVASGARRLCGPIAARFAVPSRQTRSRSETFRSLTQLLLDNSGTTDWTSAAPRALLSSSSTGQ